MSQLKVWYVKNNPRSCLSLMNWVKSKSNFAWLSGSIYKFSDFLKTCSIVAVIVDFRNIIIDKTYKNFKNQKQQNKLLLPLQGQNPLQVTVTDTLCIQFLNSMRQTEEYVWLSDPQTNSGFRTGHGIQGFWDS